MPHTHFLFIPAVFLTGALAGFVAGTHQTSHAPAGVRGEIRPAAVLASLGVFLVTFLATHFAPIPGGVRAVHTSLNHQELFDQSPVFSTVDLYGRVEAFGEHGRAAYRQFTYTTDLVFPLALFLFLVVLGRFASARVELDRAALVVVGSSPAFWLAADLLENSLIYALLSAYPAQHMGAATLLPYVTVAKFSLLLLSVVAPLAALALSAREA